MFVVFFSFGDINFFGFFIVGRAVDEVCDIYLSFYDFFGDIRSILDDSDNELYVSVDFYLFVFDSFKDYSSSKIICKDNICKDVSCGNNISKDISNGNNISMDISNGKDISIDISMDVSKGDEVYISRVFNIIIEEESIYKNFFDNINGGMISNYVCLDLYCVINDSVNFVVGIIFKLVNDLVGLVYDGDVSCGANFSVEVEFYEFVVNNIYVIDNIVFGCLINNMEGINIGNEI